MTKNNLPKILCPDPDSFSVKGKEYAQKFSKIHFLKLTQGEFEKKAPLYDALLVRFNFKIDHPILTENSKVKAILSPTTGLDHINLKLAEKYDISVYHLKNKKNILEKLNATSELTMTLILNLFRNIQNATESVKFGNWNPSQFRGCELNKKTLGIVGLGRLGKKVAKYANAFGMRVIFYDPYVNKFSKIYEKISDFKKFLNLSDVVSIHVPLNEETSNLIGAKELNYLKNSYLINTSRGKIVNSEALIFSLKNKILKGAALDVIDNEHEFILNKKNDLIEYSKLNSNLIITPHIGGTTFESVEKTDLYILKQYFNKKK